MNIFMKLPQFQQAARQGASSYWAGAPGSPVEVTPNGIFDYVARVRFWGTVEGLDKATLCWAPIRNSQLLGDLFELYVAHKGNLRSLSSFVELEFLLPIDMQELAETVIVRINQALEEIPSLGQVDKANLEAEMLSLMDYCMTYESVRICYKQGGGP